MTSFRIQFDDGHVTGETTDADDLAILAGLQEAKERGQHWLTVGFEGARLKTVGDIRSIEISAGGES